MSLRLTRLPWLLLAALPALTLAQRDPTEPPPAARAAAPDTAGTASAPAAEPVVRHLMTVDGRRWLLDGSRRYGPGDRWGTVRIECIHDDGVTVRDDQGQRQRLRLVGAVSIRPSGQPAPAAGPCPAPEPKASAPSKRPPR